MRVIEFDTESAKTRSTVAGSDRHALGSRSSGTARKGFHLSCGHRRISVATDSQLTTLRQCLSQRELISTCRPRGVSGRESEIVSTCREFRFCVIERFHTVELNGGNLIVTQECHRVSVFIVNALEIIVSNDIIQSIAIHIVMDEQLSADRENVRCNTCSDCLLNTSPSGNVHLRADCLSNLFEVFIHFVELT